MGGVPILVTGSNRSGTTWVGRMLALSPQLAYVHEPFNPTVRPPMLDVALEGHYTYVHRENEQRYLQPVRDVVAFRPPLRRQLATMRTPLDVARVARSSLRSAEARRRHARPLLKDPIAIFAAPWLSDRFGMDVVMMIRHPAAYVSSIQRLGWTYDFSFLLQQEPLVADHFPAFRDEIRAFADREHPPFEQAILLWKLMYTFVDRCRETHPNWQYVRHEDLSADPVEGFRSMYRRLDIPFDPSIGASIASYTGEQNVGERSVAERHDVRRDSRSVSRTWWNRLSDEQVARIRTGIGPMADRFYDDATWTRP